MDGRTRAEGLAVEAQGGGWKALTRNHPACSPFIGEVLTEERTKSAFFEMGAIIWDLYSTGTSKMISMARIEEMNLGY